MDLFATLPVPRLWPLSVVGLVAVSRLLELAVSRRHEKALRAKGAQEVGAAHYPYIIAVHTGWLVSLAVWAWTAPAMNGPLMAIYLLIQPLRLWVIAGLGPYWTTRIITLPGAPLVARGPYRYFRHPNYLVVVVEIAVLPLALGAWPVAAVFSVLNGIALWIRITAENQALNLRPAAPPFSGA